jgi:hypothetical protein
MRIQVSPGELDAGRLQDETVEAAVDALFGDGYVVLGDVVEHAALDLLRRRLEEDTAELLRRIEAEGRTFEPAGQLSQPMPRSPEHVHRTIVANPLVIQVTKEVLGEGVHNHFYNCNTNLPGSRAQFLHRDAPNLGLDPAHPMVSIIVNVSMGDVDESNGATEIWPGTHWVEGRRVSRTPQLRDAAPSRLRRGCCFRRGTPSSATPGCGTAACRTPAPRSGTWSPWCTAERLTRATPHSPCRERRCAASTTRC